MRKDEEVHYQRAYSLEKIKELIGKSRDGAWQCMMLIHWSHRRKIAAGLPL